MQAPTRRTVTHSLSRRAACPQASQHRRGDAPRALELADRRAHRRHEHRVERAHVERRARYVTRGAVSAARHRRVAEALVERRERERRDARRGTRGE
jgi:hypothetical protein